MNYKKIFGCLFAIVVLFVFSSPAKADKIYRYIDENGNVGFTDNLSHLPEKYLNSVTQYADTEPGDKAALLEGEKRSRTSEKSEFPEDVDFDGHDEAWWKNRAQELKERKESLLKQKLSLQQEYDTNYAIWLNPFAPGNQNIAKINQQIQAGQRPDPKLFFGLAVPQPEIAQNQ